MKTTSKPKKKSSLKLKKKTTADGNFNDHYKRRRTA